MGNNIVVVIKDEVLITVGCPIFPSILIAKYLFTGSLKKKSIDNLETQKNGTAVTNRLQNSFKITCTDHRIIEILGLRPSNRLPVSY